MFDQETAKIEQANLEDDALTLDELTEIMHEIEEQPHWRHIADKEMDYADGNQLETELLNRMKAIGIPTEMFTVIFALGRAVGWYSHWNEMVSTSYKIGRPRQQYTGSPKRDYPAK